MVRESHAVWSHNSSILLQFTSTQLHVLEQRSPLEAASSEMPTWLELLCSPPAIAGHGDSKMQDWLRHSCPTLIYECYCKSSVIICQITSICWPELFRCILLFESSSSSRPIGPRRACASFLFFFLCFSSAPKSSNVALCANHSRIKRIKVWFRVSHVLTLQHYVTTWWMRTETWRSLAPRLSGMEYYWDNDWNLPWHQEAEHPKHSETV